MTSLYHLGRYHPPGEGETPTGGGHRLPDADEIPSLVVRPGSITWNRASDPRLYLVAPYALMLQVSHPTIGSGVRDHSTFEHDPFNRLLRTIDYIGLMVYGGMDAAAVGRNLRKYHKEIKGTNPDGSRYSALEPEAYAWVHATLVHSVVVGHARFGNPLDRDEIDDLYQQWSGIGRMIGVRPGDLPPDWTGFQAYFDEMVGNRLVRNETVDRVFNAIRSAPKRPLKILPTSLWSVLFAPASHVFSLATVGLLSPMLRDRFGVPWTKTQESELLALGAVSRSLIPVLPRRLKTMGPDYLRLRRRYIANGALAPGRAI
jgi:uncharacterized protein (DUF2236 family)